MKCAAALSNGMASGMAKTAARGATTRRASPPRGRGGEATTRWPTARSTPSPTASTVPPTSAPGVNGRGGFSW